MRRVTHEEAEAAYTRELRGEAFSFGDICGAKIAAVRLPDTPFAGGDQGKGFFPLTFEVESDGAIQTVETGDGPQVDEVRAFLYGTIPDRAIDDKLELWFEDKIYPGDGGGCGC